MLIRQDYCVLVETQILYYVRSHGNKQIQFYHGKEISLDLLFSRLRCAVQVIVYHIGASLKDLGKRLFAFDKMGLSKDLILSQVR